MKRLLLVGILVCGWGGLSATQASLYSKILGSWRNWDGATISKTDETFSGYRFGLPSGWYNWFIPGYQKAADRLSNVCMPLWKAVGLYNTEASRCVSQKYCLSTSQQMLCGGALAGVVMASGLYNRFRTQRAQNEKAVEAERKSIDTRIKAQIDTIVSDQIDLALNTIKSMTGFNCQRIGGWPSRPVEKQRLDGFLEFEIAHAYSENKNEQLWGLPSGLKQHIADDVGLVVSSFATKFNEEVKACDEKNTRPLSKPYAASSKL
jgi:hypothetical protein